MMTKKSIRNIEFAIQLAIDALRREIDHNCCEAQPVFDDHILQPDCHIDRYAAQRDKHRRDLERAISILKAIKAGIYESEGEW